jgi:four helix bundle protein
VGKRSSAFEFKRYLEVAMGSCDECKFWIAMSKDEGYLSPENYQEFIDRFNPVGAMLRSHWKY